MIHRKARSLMSAPEAIATVAAAALSQAASQQTGPTGSVVTHNSDGTKTITGSVLATDATGTSVTTATHVGDTTPPGVPTGIAAWSGDGSVHVSWDGTLAGGIPADFHCVNILVGGARIAQLAKAGSTTYLDVAVGTTVSVTATSEDDACLADGTPAHNVSPPCAGISVEVTDVANDAKSTANDAQKTAVENKEAIDTAQKDQSNWNSKAESRIVSLEKGSAGFEASISTLTGTTSQLTDDVSGLKDTQTSIKSYMTFTDPNSGNPKLTIGTSASKMKSELGNTKLAFVSDDTEVASIDGETSTLNAQRVQIGPYCWMPTNDGANLTLVYMG